MRIVLLVGRDSDRIASGPTRVQVRCVVRADDKVAPRHGGQALALSSVARNIVTFGREGSSSMGRVQRIQGRRYVHPPVRRVSPSEELERVEEVGSLVRVCERVLPRQCLWCQKKEDEDGRNWLHGFMVR